MTCAYDPRPLLDKPIGMFHCPECGEMVVAGLAHPKSDYVAVIDGPSSYEDAQIAGREQFVVPISDSKLQSPEEKP